MGLTSLRWQRAAVTPTIVTDVRQTVHERVAQVPPNLYVVESLGGEKKKKTTTLRNHSVTIGKST